MIGKASAKVRNISAYEKTITSQLNQNILINIQKVTQHEFELKFSAILKAYDGK